MDLNRGDWWVEIKENGRAGTIEYSEPAGRLSLFWEFGGSNTIASISGGNLDEWATRYPHAVDRRNAILQRIAEEVIRQKAPGSRAEINFNTGLITFHSVGTAERVRPPKTNPPGLNRQKFYLLGAAVGIVVAIIALGVGLIFTGPQPKGIPLSASVRAGDHIVTLIQTQEAYIPSLHRNPEKDRYRVDMFCYPVDGSGPERTHSIGRDYRYSELQFARIVGFDGKTVWYAIDTIEGIEIKSGKKIRAEDLQQANPAIKETWDDPRRFSFNERLRLSTPDRREAYEINPDSLGATPVKIDPAPSSLALAPKLEQYLSQGVRVGPTEWLGLLSKGEAETEFKPNSRIRPDARASNSKDVRVLYRGNLGDEITRGNQQLLSLTPVTEDSFLNTAFIRSGAEAPPIRLSAPDGFLFIYTSNPGLKGTLMAGRMDASGTLIWKTDTGLDRFRLQQILPDTRYLVFVGPPLPEPDVVSPILLAILDTETGALSSVSLNR
ncbi:MAG: hypothetical protein KJT03_19655 [Verrucomicrobiae bacterium]|nr:hypothetical protein [Verrucomicrobiae bacterium]